MKNIYKKLLDWIFNLKKLKFFEKLISKWKNIKNNILNLKIKLKLLDKPIKREIYFENFKFNEKYKAEFGEKYFLKIVTSEFDHPYEIKNNSLISAKNLFINISEEYGDEKNEKYDIFLENCLIFVENDVFKVKNCENFFTLSDCEFLSEKTLNEKIANWNSLLKKYKKDYKKIVSQEKMGLTTKKIIEKNKIVSNLEKINIILKYNPIFLQIIEKK